MAWQKNKIPRVGMANNTDAIPFDLSVSEEFSVFAVIMFVFIIVTSVVCNLALIATIARDKKLRSLSHVFIINLAVSDLLTATLLVPFDVDYMIYKRFRFGYAACTLMQTSLFISLPSSVLSLLLLTMERLITVSFPFKRRTLLSKRSITFALTCLWSYTIVQAFFPVMRDPEVIVVQPVLGLCYINFSKQYEYFQLAFNFACPTLLVCCANIALLVITNHNVNKNRTTLGTFTGDDNQVRKRKCRATVSNFQAVRRITLLVGVFLFSWLTYIVLVAYNLSCGMCLPREITWLSNIINYSCIAINPVMYGLLNLRVRNQIIRNARRLFGLASASADGFPLCENSASFLDGSSNNNDFPMPQFDRGSKSSLPISV